MSLSKDHVGYIYIVMAGCLWATTGSFVKTLYTLQLTPLQVAMLRAPIAFLALLIVMLIFRRGRYLRMAPRDLPLVAVMGLIGVSVFSALYFYTIQITTITRAVLLLYSSPIVVTLIARIIFKELLVKAKVAALLFSIAGIAVLTKIYNPSSLSIPALGIITGLGAALSYALFSLIGKSLLKRFSPWTVNLYTFGFGFLFLIPIANPSPSILHIPMQGWLFLVSMAMVSSLAAFSCFYKGLSMVEVSRASIILNIEPVIASSLGFLIFGETPGLAVFIGGTLILLGAILAQR